MYRTEKVGAYIYPIMVVVELLGISEIKVPQTADRNSQR